MGSRALRASARDLHVRDEHGFHDNDICSDVYQSARPRSEVENEGNDWQQIAEWSAEFSPGPDSVVKKSGTRDAPQRFQNVCQDIVSTEPQLRRVREPIDLQPVPYLPSTREMVIVSLRH